MLPKTFKEIKARLLAQLDEIHAPHVSFMSDIWTSRIVYIANSALGQRGIPMLEQCSQRTAFSWFSHWEKY
jgi:hypothetical protein